MTSAPRPFGASAPRPFGATAPRGPGEGFGTLALAVCTLASAALAASVIGVVGLEAVRFLMQVPPSRFFGELAWAPLAEEAGFGVLPLLAGTAQIAAGATFLALPVGVLAAAFLRFFAAGRAARLLNAALTLLSHVPAIVYGYFALNFVTPAIRSVWPGVEGFNGISACLVVGLMILPTIAALSRDALRAVPSSVVEEGVALGATGGRVLLRVVAPAAAPGILGAVVLATTRAVGETMIVTLAAGNPAGPTWSPLDGVRTLTTFLAQASMGDIPAGTIEYGACFAVAALLLLLTYAMHALGRALINRGSNRIPQGPNRIPQELNRIPQELNRIPQWPNRIPHPPSPAAPARLARGPIRIAATAAAALTLAAWILLTVVLLVEAREVFDVRFLLDPPSRVAELAGLGPALAGSLWLTVLVAAVAVPVGVGTAVWLAEYAAANRAAQALGSVLANLAGVPSIVYGMAGLALFARGLGLGPSILAGALTLGALAVPIVVVNCRAALEAVPGQVRWSAFALGATRWQVVRRQVLPAATPRIAAGCCTAMLRAVGAAAPLLILGAVSFTTFAPDTPAAPLTALPTQVFAWAVRPQDGFLALAAGASVALLLLMALIHLILHPLRRSRRGAPA